MWLMYVCEYGYVTLKQVPFESVIRFGVRLIDKKQSYISVILEHFHNQPNKFKICDTI